MPSLSRVVGIEKQSPLPKFAIFNTETTGTGLSYLNYNIVNSQLSTCGSGSFVNTDSANYSWSYWHTGTNLATSQYYAKHTTHNAFAGNSLLHGSAARGGSLWSYTSAYQYTENEAATWIDFEGVRSDIYIGISSQNIRQRVRGTHTQLDILAGYNSNTYVTVPASSVATNNGMGCYNRRTRSLAVLQAIDANGNYRLHLWTHPQRDLTGKPRELHNFMSEAKSGVNGATYTYRDFLWNTNLTADNTSRYGIKLVLGDNGSLALFRASTSSSINLATYIPSTSTLNATVNSTAVSTTFFTTAYAQPSWNITWDNSTVAFYTAYYYYGCGIASYYINTYDPTKYMRYVNADSSYSGQIVPIRESNFALMRDVNSDGGGVIMNITRDSLKDYVPITSGALINLQGTYVDLSYASTQYPGIIALDNWSDV